MPFQGLLNNSISGHKNGFKAVVTLLRVECSKKSVQQGRWLPGSSRRATPLFCARSVQPVREHSRPEERSRLARPHRRDHRCEPEGLANGENAAGDFFQHSHCRISSTESMTAGSLFQNRQSSIKFSPD